LGKKVLITNAGREFGPDTCDQFACLGAELLLCARTIQNTRATETVVRSGLPEANPSRFAADLTDARQLPSGRAAIAALSIAASTAP